MKDVIKIAVVILLVLYLIMFLTTNPLMNTVKDVVYGEYDGEFAPYSKLSYFDFSNGHSDVEVYTYSMHRLFVIHGFRHGYIWVRYTIETNHRGGANIPSRWEIQKINGKWDIIDIKEDP